MSFIRLEGPQFKTPPCVSKAARDFARGQTCTLRLDGCDGGTETTVLAHLRFFGWAGISQKPHDFLAVLACSSCHDAIDRRNNRDTALWEFEDILRALGETQSRLYAAGLLTLKGSRT